MILTCWISYKGKKRYVPVSPDTHVPFSVFTFFTDVSLVSIPCYFKRCSSFLETIFIIYRYIALLSIISMYRKVTDYCRRYFSECDSMGSYPDLIKQHSRNPRMLLNIIHPDAVNEIVAPGYHGKSHMIISLLQDYRHGAPTANSLLVPIGFTIYKVCFNIDICVIFQ